MYENKICYLTFNEVILFLHIYISKMNILLNNCLKYRCADFCRSFSQTKTNILILQRLPVYFQLSERFSEGNEKLAHDLAVNMVVYENFLSSDEENGILAEIEPYLKNLRYEFDHWDDAIHGYRETERLKWNPDNNKILERVRQLAFPPNVAQIKHVHILDLDPKGYIKPHIDSVRFCGDTIAGLSLLSNSVMRLVHNKWTDLHANVLLKRRSLYIMKNTARFDYTHEILCNEHSKFNNEVVCRDRRISIICRNEPKSENEIC